LAIVTVGLGGVAVGFFLWYEAITHGIGLAGGGDVVFAAALLIGFASAYAGWIGYAGYFARRAGVSLETALRVDTISWALLTSYGLGFVLPANLVGPNRGAAIALGLWSLAKILIAARFVGTVRSVLATFVVTRISLIAIAELAAAIIGQRPGEHIAESTNPLLSVWARWDAVHYLDIAASGYYGTDMAFFPLYPILIHLATPLVGNALIASLIISNVACFFGLLFFYKLVEHQYNRSVAQRAVFYISIFPTAIFFSAAYTESLFFALTVASFYYIREHRWVTAGVIGGLAALTRSEGVLLVVPYAIELFTPVGGSFFFHVSTSARAVRAALGGILIPCGLGLYMAWLTVLNGDPLYFSHVQAHWNRHLAPPWVSVWHSIHTIAVAKSGATEADQSLQLTFTALMIAILVAGCVRLRPSFTAYMALSIVVPMSTSSLMSMQRFALVLFPMFIILALWGSRPWVNTAIVVFSLPLLGLFTVLFADWYWVA
jgi:hypothetical protein